MGDRRSFEERQARLREIEAQMAARQEQPKRHRVRNGILLAGVFLLIGGAVAAALYVQFLYQTPATVLAGDVVRREGEWQRVQRPSLTPLISVAEWIFPYREGDRVARSRRGDYAGVGPQAALADAALCYRADGQPVPTTRAGRPPVGDGGCTVARTATRTVGSAEGLRAAVRDAQPGDIIELLPGRYAIGGSPIDTRRGGTSAAPILLRADRPGTVTLETRTGEAMRITQPFWVIENLAFEADCGMWGCEHALHVSGAGRSAWIRNNSFRDYNAAIKANSVARVGAQPDRLTIEANRFWNRAVQPTTKPVTPIDVVAADDVVIRANRISDFGKGESDRISYGLFVKGGSKRPIIEGNHVRCAENHGGGTRVGISLGGGGTAPRMCSTPDCAEETVGGIVRANVVEQCSDVGIYLNKAAASLVANNLLADTRGIDARYAATDAEVFNNIIDGRIAEWDGAHVHAAGNAMSGLRAATLRSQVRTLLRDPDTGDLGFKSEEDAARRGRTLPARSLRFEDFCGRLVDGRAPPVGPIEQRGGTSCAAGSADQS